MKMEVSDESHIHGNTGFRGGNVGRNHKKRHHTMENKFKRTTVTSALPYANGPVHIGHPYRDGSFEYYIGEKMRDNDAKATGPFIMGCPIRALSIRRPWCSAR